MNDVSSSNTYKILIVDDEVDIVELLAEEFEEDGHEVFQASSGNKAISILENNQDIKVVLSDYRMPDGNGLDLLNFVNTIEEKNRPGFFFLSGFSDLSVDELISAGALAFFTKPFNVPKLMESIALKLKQR